MDVMSPYGGLKKSEDFKPFGLTLLCQEIVSVLFALKTAIPPA